ncbi:MAG: hypothetical protein IIA45_10175 [Bacteroidetes bacterium]|nr:hypothetical protein [Bacteroidota bacterium]
MKSFIYFTSCLVLFSCSTKPEEKVESEKYEIAELAEQVEINKTEEYDIHEKIEGFQSELRLGKTDWNLEETFTDSLEFIEYNTDYDYWYAVFKNKEGKEIALYTNTEIDNFYQNRDFVVKWRVGKFSEAGEGEAIYYSEKLVSYNMLNSSSSFEKFLKQFSETYSNGKPADINKYIHSYQELTSTYKNGLYCIDGRPDDLPKPEYFAEDYTVTSEKPEGDFCEGYEGVKDGLYYEFFDEAHDLFPRVYDFSEEGGTERSLYLTENILYQYFAKIKVITEQEFNRHLYFFKEQDRWFFWVEDFCDCSA